MRRGNQSECRCCNGTGKIVNRDIPICCGFALKEDYSRAGKEWSCPTCKRFYDIFDDYHSQSCESMTEEQKTVARERGWIIPLTPEATTSD